MRRFTILSLMGLVLALAVGLAALRGANDYWAGGLMTATPLAFGIALLGALRGRESSGSGRLGFAVLGGVYFSLAFLGLSELNLSKLPTSMLLRYVHERVGPSTNVVLWSMTGAPGKAPIVRLTGSATQTVLGDGDGMIIEGVAGGGIDTNIGSRWKILFPGAANLEAFSSVGHCQFALLSGLMGSAIARRFERGRLAERAAE